MKLRLPRRRIFRAAIYLVSLVLILIAIDLVLVQVRRTIHPGYETTRIIEPTMPDGSIDYLSAIDNYFSRGVTPENNAAIPILQALGRKALSSKQPPDGITDRLGMPHLPEKGDYYVTYMDYFKAHSVEEDEVDPTNDSVAWPVTISPAARSWVQGNEKPLALLTEASNRSRYFIPCNGGNRPKLIAEVLLPQVTLLNDARRAFLTRALMRIEAGDAAGFREDIGTSHRLARLMGQDSTIVGRLVGVIQERSTCRVERLGIASGKLSQPQMRDMLADLTAVGEQPSMIEAIDAGERFMDLDLLQAMSKGTAAEQADLMNSVLNRSEPKILFCFLPIPYEECMRAINRFQDGGIVAMRQPTYAQRVAAWNLLDRGFENLSPDNRMARFLTAEWPVSMLRGTLFMANTRVDVAHTDTQLTQIALALAIFKSEHGSYPGALSELVPAYLPAVPDDLFSDQPLKYSRTGDAYTLYSVGPNTKDDSGKGKKPADDIDANEIYRTLGHVGATSSPASQP